ncbi:Sodium-dependent multivitamin transporter [Araneus ventricosus]|uniref:Sodium-dependent multivitamin transporter n=1 Tax=Araneus ventricosus TaxID=182803 RepID=A0A4Y2GWQ5_ARAVE|nr:Sodium-dependent multivitamin transporter [Araneus ventricosus]
MAAAYYLGVLDYLIIAFTLLISTAIGITFKSSSKGTGKMREYFMAGKNMALLPVIMSTTATMISPLTTMGIPAEIYRYGIQLWTLALGTAVGMVLAAYIFIPVYFQCDVCTVYEVLWTSPILYSPVLALNAITDLPLELSILAFGAICSIYCAVGGLKAVLWTDVFQTILMFVTALMLLVAGIKDVGGFANVLDRAKEGGRLNMFNFQIDFTTRYTFWNGFFQGLSYGVTAYGVNQTGVQRLLSLSKIERAKS